MLVLSRQINESIVINDNIEVVVVDIRGDKVRLGITAPLEVPVHRKEVQRAIERDQAMQDALDDFWAANPEAVEAAS